MDNIDIILATNIQRYRKLRGLTQDELAVKLGVTFQAVSKWENAKSAPDISFLPVIADLFGCSIDGLFSREVGQQNLEFPWKDDNVIRVVQTKGTKILNVQNSGPCFEVAFPKNCNETTRQYFKVEVFGNIACEGSINGDVVCHGRISCYDINGDVRTDGDIYAYAINSLGNVTCGGEIKHRSAAEADREDVPEYMQPIRTDKITVGDREFEASYFGEQDISSWSVYTKREFWRLENAENAFKRIEKTGDVLPYNNYPYIKFRLGQFYVIDYHDRDGNTERHYHLADGSVWQNMICTRRVVINAAKN